MKITGYRSITTVHNWGHPIGDVNGSIDSGVTEVPILIVETDEGLEGIGLGGHDGIERVFPAVEGEDPRAVTALYDRMLGWVFKSGHAGSVFGAIGVLDMALWDLKAKMAGEPLWRTLGARDRFVPGYASCLDGPVPEEDLPKLWSEWADRGFHAVKVKGGANMDADLRRLHMAEEIFGTDGLYPSIFFDVNESWSTVQAVRNIRRIEQEVNLAWIEEPARRWDASGLRNIREHVATPVASGENLTGLEQFKPLIDTASVDVVQTGSCWGITHALRVANYAFANQLPYSPVGYNANPVAAAAASMPNHMIIEIQSLQPPVGIHSDQTIADGGIVLGDEPGLGYVIDEEAIAHERRCGTWTVPQGPHVRPAAAGFRL